MNTMPVNTSDKESDDTDYLMASEVMKERLDKAMEEEKNGEGVKITLDDIWQ